MKYYGDINLNNNEMQNMVLGVDTTFPAVAKVGQVVFIHKRVYIAVELVTGTPSWVPLTNELNTYEHSELVPQTTWTIPHNLNSTMPMVQVYNAAHQVILPDEITVMDNNTVDVTFNVAQAGRAVVFHGTVNGADPQATAYVHYQTSSSDTWVIPHELGYYPIVRIFVGNEEILPVSVIHDSLFQTTISFSTPYVGNARLV